MKKEEKQSIVPGSEKETDNQIPKKSGKKGKTPKQVVRKHIRDKNDVISEEDFKNLDISVDVNNDTANEVLEIPDDKKRPKDEDKDPKTVTPWNVISE
jgi:hypothetical protein